MAHLVQHRTETDEKKYLEIIKDKLSQAITAIDAAVSAHAKDVQDTKNYLYENKAGMDHVEKVSVRQSITQTAIIGESAVAKKKRLAKLINSPYFGRIDFVEKKDPEPLYIGIHTFFDAEQNTNLIHDWRAPVASMFYDYEPGPAAYESPAGKVAGEITLKRQYRIRQGKMEFMLESGLNIHDDVLQKELSQASSDRMKNIVATIQRNQNAIIRNEDAATLIIQGVAGSGKTSIALHRIAFLLYRHKDTIKAEDILIISPNKVFADYISNVLPELGEEQIGEKGMEELAHEMLEGKYKFQRFFEQVNLLIEKDDEAFKSRMRFKASREFLQKLNAFCVHIENTYFTPELFMVARNPIPPDYLQEKYQQYHRLPLFKRIAQMAQDVANDLHFFNQYEPTAKERSEIRRQIEKMFKTLNLRTLYKKFYDWMGKPEMHRQAKGSRLEYADVFPLVYLKLKLEGSRTYEKVKHLVVDEMQDYTPLQYQVLLKLFPCNKTILGDSNQSVNPYSSSSAESIAAVFPSAEIVKMNKSYRSTFEIIEFAQKINFNPEMEAVERHGEKPQIHVLTSNAAELEYIKNLIRTWQKSGYASMGIICKNQAQAEYFYGLLKETASNIYVLNSQSVSFANGIVVTSAHMAKGLEFDEVLVPDATSVNYKTLTDRQMLYVACTRAMHRLTLTATENITEVLQNELE